MAIPNGVTRYVVSGTLASGEIWQCAFYVDGWDPATFPTDATLATLPTTPPWDTFLADMSFLLAPADAITAVDLYFITGGVAVKHAHVGFNMPGIGTARHPTQCSVVLTERTALATRSGRGRIYVPATGIVITDNGLMTAGPVNALVDGFASVLTELSTDPLTAVVVSQTLGVATPITSVDADLVPDTQRRRVNKLHSTRHSHTV
jgi:hypothetical protein